MIRMMVSEDQISMSLNMKSNRNKMLFTPHRLRVTHHLWGLTLLVLMVLAHRLLLADNVLMNPGFEANPPGDHHNLVAWNCYGQNRANALNQIGSPARTGSNYCKMFQGLTGRLNYAGLYQDIASGPGAAYSAEGWAYICSTDSLAGQNAAWLEVTFRSAQGNVLALYRSAVVTTNALATAAFPFNSWFHLSITNQYNPANDQITNRSAVLVAPAGTSYVRYQIVFHGDPHHPKGSLYFDDLSLACIGGASGGHWNIVWSDEFNGNSINPRMWTFDMGNGFKGWGNNELQYYTSRSQNAYASNGLLHIVARRESLNGFGYTSARLKTQGLFTRKYGRIEFRARLPQGVGFWPALWLLGENIASVGWPACGEIDVMENKGTEPNQVQGTIHFGGSLSQVYTLPGDSVTNFHQYLLEWTTNAILWYVDGLLYQTQTNWSSFAGPYPTPFNQPFFLIMNLAVGGNYVGNPSSSAIDSGAVFPAEMVVDYVRVYDPAPPPRLQVIPTNASLLFTWPGNLVWNLEADLGRDSVNGFENRLDKHFKELALGFYNKRNSPFSPLFSFDPNE